MGEFDFLSQAPGRRRVQPPKAPKRTEGGESPAKPASAKPEPQTGGRAKPPVETVSSAAEMANRSIQRELEKEGYTMPAASAGTLADAERQDMLERQEARDEAEAKRNDFLALVKAIKEQLGTEYKRDLILEPPMWAAQDLQPGYGTRQDRTASAISDVELPRLCRVLEAAGYTLKKKPESKKDAAE